VTKRAAFRLSAVFVAVALSAILAEAFLRIRWEHIHQSDQLDPGMVKYDSELGWTLTPHWTGEHRHHDFAVHYAIDQWGFRNSGVTNAQPGERWWAVVGDSFTFGLGVNDEATFVHLLNRAGPGRARFRNFAVPGYSTDQEALLVEREILPLSPFAIVLMVYLGNDLFDNQLPFPIQGNHGKPFFKMEGERLVLQNTPVPAREKSAMDDENRSPWRRFALGQLLGETWSGAAPRAEDFDRRYDTALRLFVRIIERMHAEFRKKGVKFVVVLLGGRSFVEKPSSISAQYQDLLRRGAARDLAADKLPVLDAALWMRQRYGQERRNWFYPNDGHLNPDGHAQLANFLREELQKTFGETAR